MGVAEGLVEVVARPLKGGGIFIHRVATGAVGARGKDITAQAAEEARTARRNSDGTKYIYGSSGNISSSHGANASGHNPSASGHNGYGGSSSMRSGGGGSSMHGHTPFSPRSVASSKVLRDFTINMNLNMRGLGGSSSSCSSSGDSVRRDSYYSNVENEFPLIDEVQHKNRDSAS
jgi:hypothetical protein